MKLLGLILFAIVVPGGSLILLSIFLRRERTRRHEETRTDLVPRWRAFIRSNPRIPPARVPIVRVLKAQPQRTVSKVSEFRQRGGR